MGCSAGLGKAVKRGRVQLKYWLQWQPVRGVSRGVTGVIRIRGLFRFNFFVVNDLAPFGRVIFQQ